MKLPKLSLNLNFDKLKHSQFGALFSFLELFSANASREPTLTRFVFGVVAVSVLTLGSAAYFLKKTHDGRFAHDNDKSVVARDGHLEEFEAVQEGSESEESEEVEENGELAHAEAGEESEHADGAEHQASEEHGEVAEGEGGHGEEKHEVLETNPFPEEILKRQNGIPAAGYDLKEPKKDLLREIASAKNSDLEVRVGNYFIDLDTIYSNARVGTRTDGALIVDITLELSSYGAREEVSGRKEELRAIVNSLLFEFQKEELLSYEGKMALKARIQSEFNHKLKSGKVEDVLLSNIHMRP